MERTLFNAVRSSYRECNLEKIAQHYLHFFANFNLCNSSNRRSGHPSLSPPQNFFNISGWNNLKIEWNFPGNLLHFETLFLVLPLIHPTIFFRGKYCAHIFSRGKPGFVSTATEDTWDNVPISREAYIKNYLILTASDFFPAPLFISLSDTRFTEAGQESLFLKRRANRVNGVVNEKNFKKKILTCIF